MSQLGVRLVSEGCHWGVSAYVILFWRMVIYFLGICVCVSVWYCMVALQGRADDS